MQTVSRAALNNGNMGAGFSTSAAVPVWEFAFWVTGPMSGAATTKALALRLQGLELVTALLESKV